MVKLLLSWNIKADEETAYFEFVTQEFVPGVLRLGIRPVEAWYTVYGQGPQIITSAEANDRQALTGILEGPEWAELMQKLERFVTDFKQRIVNKN